MANEEAVAAAAAAVAQESSNIDDNKKVDDNAMDANVASAEVINDEDLMNIIDAEEYLMRKDVELLDYEKQMFLDMVYCNGLMVCAKGINYDRVLINILKVYSDAGNLILVINSSGWEEDYYKNQLDNKYIHKVATNGTERERVYLEGGIQFISTRILVVDLLKHRIPIQLITGIIVMRAHTVIESCQEAFAINLYRQHNKTGFIKAFSNSAEAFTIGYSHIERTMRNLFVKELFIWPRFHAIIDAVLKSYPAQTVELNIKMSPKMTLIQMNLLDIMNHLVLEIKRINRVVDLEEITVENCVTKKFHKILQAQLNAIWHQLNSQTKLIIADLKILRNLMISTIYHDTVSAYMLMKQCRTMEYALSNSGWTLLDAAEQIFKLSKERVFNSENEFEPEPCPKWKALNTILMHEIPDDFKSLKGPNCPDQPKVLILCQDARTCYQLNQLLTQSGERFLLCQALRQQLAIGKLSKSYEKLHDTKEIEAIQNQNQRSNDSNIKKSKETSKKHLNKFDEGENDIMDECNGQDELTQLLNAADAGDEELDICNFHESYILTMTQTQLNDSNNASQHHNNSRDYGNDSSDEDTNNVSVFQPFSEADNLDLSTAVTACKLPLICIQTFKTELEGSMALNRVLNEIEPQYVIMYHSNVTAIRQLEVYEARKRRSANERIKIYFLVYAKTVEEQSFLTSLRREKQTFEMIIEMKRKSVITKYQDGKTDEAFNLNKISPEDETNIGTSSSSTLESANKQSRCAGGQVAPSAVAATTKMKIIVDMREFRSDLPGILHKRGFEVLPVTIAVGDYILTPEICVERKSISDLIGSLNSGRLYNQCIQMQRNYAQPILLIEFDQNRPFHLQGKFMLSQNTSSTNADIMQKLQLLTLHFPKLRLIWLPSPYATAQLFEELKLGKEQPDHQQIAAIGASDDLQNGFGCDDVEENKINTNIYDFLLRLPGVNTRNVHQLLRRGDSLKGLLKLTQVDLSTMLSSENSAKLLYNTLHVGYLPEKDELPVSTAITGKQFVANRFQRGFKTGHTAAGSGRRFKK